jgi:hypothetical protein
MASVEFIGPFRYHDVVVDGWQVPHLRATPLIGGRVHLNLDRRLGLDLSVEEAERFVPFLADCIAVAHGYTAHPGPELPEPVVRLPFVRMHGIRFEEASE